MALTATPFNQAAVPTSDRDISALTSFKPLQFVASLHGTVAATVITTAPFNFPDDDSASYVVDGTQGPLLQAAGRAQTDPLRLDTSTLKTRIKQITLSCGAPFGTGKIATLVVSKVRRVGSTITVTALNDTTGNPNAANVIGQGASAGLVFDTANDSVVIPLKLTLTDAEATLERGDFFRVEWSSVTVTPGATGLTVTIKAITESIVDVPSAVS